jgi:META domain
MAAADQATVIFEWDCNIAEGWAPVLYPTDPVAPTPDTMVAWWHEIGLTKYDKLADFDRDTLVTREQAAKMIMGTIDASWVSEWMIKQPAWSCEWNDTDAIDSSLLPMVTKSCAKGLFKWSNGKFMPKAYLTDTDLMTVTSRAAQFIPALMDILIRSTYAVPTDRPLTRGELLSSLHDLYQQIAPVVVVDPPALPVVITLQGDYYLASYDGTWVANTGITLWFSGSTMSARICNYIGGEYIATDNSITFQSMISTKMACLDGQISDLESAFAWLETVSYMQDDTTITFTHGFGRRNKKICPLIVIPNQLLNTDNCLPLLIDLVSQMWLLSQYVLGCQPLSSYTANDSIITGQSKICNKRST